ncbi:NAD-dependent epimerase/dehydratase family protein [Pseudomonas sp. NPDC007930]|uniref:SDR family oxidoreductase n=1 Tax=Pseudomonas sp. NPDC007930 TaxID=3364417 RepID=UPI0036E21E28
MKIFLTGASGFVGSAVVQELLRHGHQVLGLARSEAAAQALAQQGASVLRGHLQALPSLAEGATEADAVIHCAFIHDFTRFAENCEIDRQAVLALGAALAGSTKPLIVTSGTGLLAGLGEATEGMPAPARGIPRIASEQAVLALREQGVKASIMRLPPSVHGEGDHGFVPMLIGLARERGLAAYIGNGDNRWPAVHRHAAARLYRLAIERGEARCYHAVAEPGIAFKAIAEAIGQGLGVPVRSLSAAEAEGHFGWMAHFAAMDNPASSALSRQLTGWQAEGPGLLADIAEAGYLTGA